MALELHVLKYLAEEVERQGDGPLAVYWMARAWEDAVEMKRGHVVGPTPTLRDVERWGQLVEPHANEGGYRRTGVRVGMSKPRDWPLYLEDLDALLKGIGTVHVDPDLVYLEFEKIHPFRDGNGRTGKVLFNYLKGTLADPAMPTNWFNCSNP